MLGWGLIERKGISRSGRPMRPGSRVVHVCNHSSLLTNVRMSKFYDYNHMEII